MVSLDTPLHIAARLGDTCIVKEILTRKPEYARNLNQDGYTPLHLASFMGHLEVVKELIHGAVDVCLLEDKSGRTPLYYATMMGRVEVMKELLDASPESIKEVSARRETVLNIAVFYNQYEAYKLLLERFVMENNSEFIDYKDSEANTVMHLHLAISRIQFQDLKTLLASNHSIVPAVQVNATNAASLCTLNILAPHEEMANKINKILQRAEALKSGGISTPSYSFKDNKEFVDTNNLDNLPFSCIYNNPSKTSTIKLLISAVAAITAFYAALYPPTSILHCANGNELNSSATFEYKNQNSISTTSFIFLNSTVFFLSISMILYLTNDFPLKKWLLISLSSLLGSYTCTILAVSSKAC